MFAVRLAVPAEHAIETIFDGSDAIHLVNGASWASVRHEDEASTQLRGECFALVSMIPSTALSETKDSLQDIYEFYLEGSAQAKLEGDSTSSITEGALLPVEKRPEFIIEED